MTAEIEDQALQAAVDEILKSHFKLDSIDGRVAPSSQTGERYHEVLLSLANSRDLPYAIAGIIGLKAVAGDRVYWRCRPETEGLKCYFRYLATSKAVEIEEAS